MAFLEITVTGAPVNIALGVAQVIVLVFFVAGTIFIGHSSAQLHVAKVIAQLGFIQLADRDLFAGVTDVYYRFSSIVFAVDITGDAF